VKTDIIFYRLFQEFPDIFFELIGNSPETAANYQFSSVEVKQTALRIDGVFLPENEDKAIQEAKELIARTNQEIDSAHKQQQFLQLIETILVYKFPSMDIEEIQEMFGLSELKQTRVYQQAFAEGEQKGEQKGKLLAVPPMLAAGLSLEQIAQALGLTLDEVSQAVQAQSPQ
jgi:predicted transposase YdaD